jgi:pyrrolidone-carboxylate peptidase
VNTPYLGKIGVALSLSIGLQDKDTREIPVDLNESVMTLSEFIAQQKLGRNQVFVINLAAQKSYIALLRVDINALLDSSSDRAGTLEAFIDQLNDRIRTTSQITSRLDLQGNSLTASIESM